MPSQRKKGKRQVGLWLTEEERHLIDRLVADGVAQSMSDLFKEAIIAKAKEKGIIDESDQH